MVEILPKKSPPKKKILVFTGGKTPFFPPMASPLQGDFTPKTKKSPPIWGGEESLAVCMFDVYNSVLHIFMLYYMSASMRVPKLSFPHMRALLVFCVNCPRHSEAMKGEIAFSTQNANVSLAGGRFGRILTMGGEM